MADIYLTDQPQNNYFIGKRNDAILYLPVLVKLTFFVWILFPSQIQRAKARCKAMNSYNSLQQSVARHQIRVRSVLPWQNSTAKNYFKMIIFFVCTKLPVRS